MTRAGSTALVAVALGLFLGCWTLLHHGFLERGQLTDTGTYARYGDAIADGAVPYRDFRLEYPPGALRSSSSPRSATRATRSRTTAGSTG